jgi:hypothetical protein
MDLRFDRIISIAAFEHICNLPEVVARCGLLVQRTGCLRVAVPSEGTPLWRLAWSVTTGFEFRLRYRLNYGVLMRHEHVNTAAEIRAIIGHFFALSDAWYFGPSAALSLYQFIIARKPRIDRCRDYLNSISSP